MKMNYVEYGRSKAVAAWMEGARSIAALPARRKMQLVAAILAGVALVLVMILIVPMKTYAPQYLTDHLIFLDGAHRVLGGQAPNREFHTPLGPLNYLLVALGYSLGGSLGGMMPVATTLFAACLLPLLVHTCLSRLPYGLGLAFGIYMLILTIAPVYVGSPLPNPTFAVFYNRFGYATLSVLFVFVLPRKEGFGSDVRDIVAMAAAFLLLFYLKMSYAAVAGAFLLALAAFPHTRRIAAGAGLLAAAVLVLVELFWSGTANYIRDLLVAAHASGAVRGGLESLLVIVSGNFVSGFVLLCAITIAFCAGARADYLLLCMFIAASGVLLANQNAQGAALPTLIPAALVAVLAPRRPGVPKIPGTALAYSLCLAVLGAQGTVLGLATIAVHAAGALGPRDPSAVELDGLIAINASPEDKLSTRHLCLAPADARQSLEDKASYLLIVRDGQRLLEREPRLAGKIFSFDNANPFNALENRSPPAGVDSFYHFRRSFSETAFRPADQLFRDVDVVMVPRRPAWAPTTEALLKIYGADLRAKFHLVARTDCWEAYRKNTQTIRV